MPCPNAVECVKNSIVRGTGRADRVIRAVVNGEPLPVGAGKRKTVRTGGTSWILLPVIPTVVAH